MAVLFQREKKLLKELGHGSVSGGRQGKQAHRFEREGERKTRKEWDINGSVSHYVLLLGSHELKMENRGKEKRENHGVIPVVAFFYEGPITHFRFVHFRILDTGGWFYHYKNLTFSKKKRKKNRKKNTDCIHILKNPVLK